MRHEATDEPITGRWPLWVSLALLALSATRTLEILVWAGGGWQASFAARSVALTVVFCAWALSPMIALALVARYAHRRWVSGAWVIGAGAAGLLAFTVWAFAGFKSDPSSTAALLFVFLPFYQLLVVALVVGVAAALEALLRRRRGRRRAAAA